MTSEWSPQATITPDLAARVIAEQFPDLAHLPVRSFDAGWDNAVLLVGDDVVFRFVHREIAVALAARELAVLRALPDLPLAVPRPTYIGTPTAAVPWPFWGAPFVPGREVAVVTPADGAREPLAAALGRFLARLHDPGLAERVVASAAADGVVLPVDPMRRGEPAAIAERLAPRLARLVAAGLVAPDPARDALLARAPQAPTPRGRTALVHGDLHVRHVLLSPDGTPTGVIDWGDTCLADPAVDLAFAYAALDGAAREVFVDAYGGIDPDRETTARVLAVHMCSSLAEQAAADGLTQVLAEAQRCLHRAAH